MPRGTIGRLFVVSLVLWGTVLGVSGSGEIAGSGPDSAAGPPETDTGDTATEPVTTSIHITQVEGAPHEVEYTLSYEVAPDVSSLAVYPPTDATVTSREGFSKALRWNGETAAPSVTFRTNATAYRYDTDSEGHVFTGTGNWTLTRTPPVWTRWRTPEGAASRAPFWSPAVTRSPANRTVIERTLLFVGPHETYRVSRAGQQIRLVVPDATTGYYKPRSVLQAVATRAATLNVSARSSSVLFVVGPDPSREGGVSFGSEAVVGDVEGRTAGGADGTVRTLWLHEYVHTRQAYTPSPAMAWFDEASAEYLAIRGGLRQGHLDGADAVGRLRTGQQYCSAVLTDPDSWREHKPETEYTKGPLVVAALDQRIRTATDGRRSIEDVVDRMNDWNGSITVQDFEGIVRRVAGSSTADWAGRAVSTSGCPSLEPEPLHRVAVNRQRPP